MPSPVNSLPVSDPGSAWRRRWITFFQDWHLSGGEEFYMEDKAVLEFRSSLSSARAAISKNPNGLDPCGDILRSFQAVEAAFDVMDAGLWLWWRLLGVLGLFFFFGLSIFVAVILNDWGQVIVSIAVWSRTVSIALAACVYQRSTRTTFIHIYLNRASIGICSTIGFLVVLPPSLRHLYGKWQLSLVVGVISGCILLGCTYFEPLKYSAAAALYSSQPDILEGDDRVVLRWHRDTLSRKLSRLQTAIEISDIPDIDARNFLLVKKRADRMLSVMDRHLPQVDARRCPTYPRVPKLWPFACGVLVVAYSSASYYRHPVLISMCAAWGIWVVVVGIVDVTRRFVSRKDMFDFFSASAAGPLVQLPLSITIFATKGAALERTDVRVILSVVLVLTTNVFCNTPGTLCEKFSRKSVATEELELGAETVAGASVGSVWSADLEHQ